MATKRSRGRPRIALPPVLDRKVNSNAAGLTWGDVHAALARELANGSDFTEARRSVAEEFGITPDAIRKKFNSPEEMRAVETSTLLAHVRSQLTGFEQSPASIAARFRDGRIAPATWEEIAGLLKRVGTELTLTAAERVALLTIEQMLSQATKAKVDAWLSTRGEREPASAVPGGQVPMAENK